MNRGARFTVCVMLAVLLLALAAAGCSSADRNEASGGGMSAAPAAQSNVATSSDSAMRMDNPGEATTYAAVEGGSPASLTGGAAFGAVDRKLIYSANVSMQVKDYAEAQTRLLDLTALSGGYVLSFEDTQSRYDLGGYFVLKIPSGGFHSFLADLEELKEKNFHRNVRANDVSEEYVDLTARLKAKQAVEERLLRFMQDAANTQDLLQVSAELARVQEEIETLKGRMRYLDEHVAYSTVELRMSERLVPEEDEEERPAVLQRAGKAIAGSSEGVVRFFEGVLVFVAGALPVLLALGIIAVPAVYAWRRRRRRGEQRKQIDHNQYATKVDSSKDDE